ncbi:hypothetical protein [Kitasatospora sp. KL5]|uniref:hypothetical protein n=1 Tax=Kitasatospora sp. KL5 TaxID=3425125 RepID=UPI003D701F15
MSIIARGPDDGDNPSAAPAVLRGRVVQMARTFKPKGGLSQVVLGVLVCSTVGGFSATQVMLLTAEVALAVILGDLLSSYRRV